MQALKQIVFLLDGNKLAKIDIIDTGKSKSRHTQFYHLIKNGTIQTDEDAVLHFYKTKNVQDSRYRYFKNTFRNKLINTIFFVNTHDEKVGNYQNTYTDAQRTWALINILFTRSAFVAAIDLSEQLLKICLHYEFTELVVQLTDKLKHIHGTLKGDKEKFAYFRELHFKHLAHLNTELLVKDYYQTVKIEYTKTIGFKREMQAVADKAIEELAPHVSKCDTFTFMSIWYLLRVTSYQTIYDHKNILAVCEEGINFFNQKKFETSKVTAILMNQQLISQIQLRQYEAGKKTALAVEALQIEGTHNWYKSLEQQMMLAFHTRTYGQAYTIYQIATKHKGFAYLEGRNKEIWPLFSAYLYFLIKMKRIEGIALEKSGLKDFKIQKFSNALNEISADKNGLNIPYLIINYLIQLLNKNEDKLIDGVEAMQKYIMRHVKKTDAAYRTNLFLKLLTRTTELDYSKNAIKPFADKLINEMAESPPNIMEQGDRIEIMSFEYMWDEMQVLLEE